MARTVSIGNQDFESVQKDGYFYIDKTDLYGNGGKAGIV